MILFLGLAAISGCSTGGTASPGVSGGKTVTTEFGSVRGYASSGAWIYKGIPWMRPRRSEISAGGRPRILTHGKAYVIPQNLPACVLSRYTLSNGCQLLQLHPLPVIPAVRIVSISISTVLSLKLDLPVFVWIHGGANNFGGATSYDGSTLAVRENMIVVVVQYRLAALGWFSNYALETIAAMASDSLDFSGNYGTLDQIKALTWVQHNIAAFGGDPSKVTVGEPVRPVATPP